MSQAAGIASRKAMALVKYLMQEHQYRLEKEWKSRGARPRFSLDREEPLDSSIKRRLEAFLGHNLDRVRIHHGRAAEEASRRLDARAFTYGGRIFAPKQNMDITTTKGLGLLTHEITHTIQQTDPPKVPVSHTEHAGASATIAQPLGRCSDISMVYLAANTSPSTKPQAGEAQARENEQHMIEAMANTDQQAQVAVNPELIADRIYELMKHELVLERERKTEAGG